MVALEDAPFTGPGGPIGWDRAAFDLDQPEGIGALLDRDRPDVVVHAAAWSDVDGCALDPDLAMLRNGRATGVVAEACAVRGLDLLAVSTNEVFDGRRADRVPYGPGDPPAPGNAYGASKLEGEQAAAEAFDRVGRGTLGIARTAWLFGAPGRDFPSRILDAAERAIVSGEPLRLVADEWGTPTYVHDLAEAIVELIAEDSIGGIHHLVNAGTATRADWARDVLARAGGSVAGVATVDVPSTTWQRPSVPPAWGVLAATPLPSGEPIRTWRDAMADYAPALLRATAWVRR